MISPGRRRRRARSSSLGQKTIERIETNLRPRLERIAPREQLFFRQKRDTRDHRLAFVDHRLGKFEHVHDAEMDLANFVAVVV